MWLRGIAIVLMLVGGVFVFLAFSQYVGMIQVEGATTPDAAIQNIRTYIIAAAVCLVPAEGLRRFLVHRRRPSE
jgi:O-antigen/teichoic acid export membrane protein